MEVGTVSAADASTGSQTIADIVKLAAERSPDSAALKHKVGDEWRDISYAELGEAVKEIALGLVDLGIEKGDRVSILSHTRPEWTFANFGILASGAASVSIYQTNSPEEVHYVADHSESTAIFAEDAEQLEKIRQIRDDLPHLEHVIAFESDGKDDHISLDDLRERGRAHTDEEYEERVADVTPDDVCLYIYTSGTTGPPKGCILTHGNYRRVIDMTQEMGDARRRRAGLPLPSARARVRGADPVRRDRPRLDDRLLGEGPAEDRAQPDGGEADVLPVGAADLREDLPAGHEQRARQGAARAGGAARAQGAARAAARRGSARPS